MCFIATFPCYFRRQTQILTSVLCVSRRTDHQMSSEFYPASACYFAVDVSLSTGRSFHWFQKFREPLKSVDLSQMKNLASAVSCVFSIFQTCFSQIMCGSVVD